MSEEITKEQKIEAHKVLQGERATKKKKVMHFTKDECEAELQRLERTGHSHSLYQKHLGKRFRETQGYKSNFWE